MTPPFVHPLGLCESADVGSGTRIWAFAHVMEGARIGSDCNVGGGAFVEAGAIIGDEVTIKNNVLVWDKVIIGNAVFVGPNAVFTNDLRPRIRFKKEPEEFLTTVVEDEVTIGANATIVCGVRLGRACMVGAGSVVTKDVPPYGLVVGNPARVIGWACACGLRLPASMSCACGRTYVEAGAQGLELVAGETGRPEGG